MSAFLGVELKRVVIAPPQPSEQRIRLLAVELYADGGLILRWVMPGGPPDPPKSREEELFGPGYPSFVLNDDVGTEYTNAGQLAGGGAAGYRGEVYFTPSVPPDATSLTVTGGDWSLPLPLDDD
jgi:hypothetical protein